MRNLLRSLLAACVLAPTVAFGQPDLPPCGKNHFILSEPVSCVATEVAIGKPRAIAADGEGNVYFSTENRVFKVDAQGRLSVFAGDGVPGFSGDGGPATEARLYFEPVYLYEDSYPYFPDILTGGLAVDGDGNVYVADGLNNRVRRIDRAGIIATVAGPGSVGGVEGKLETAPMEWPQSLAIDHEGNLFIADYEGTLRKFSGDGTLSAIQRKNCEHPMGGGVCMPSGLAADGQGGAFAFDSACRIRRMAPTGETKTVIGTYDRCDPSGDGVPAAQAHVHGYGGLAGDGAGGLVIADASSQCIRKVDAAGIITTIAGVCSAGGFSGDGGPAGEALFFLPSAIAVGHDGTIYIADTWNNRIRAITPDGVIRTIAGNGN